MERAYQEVREHISILKKIDSYIQHKLSDWEFKELVRTLAVEIETNRKLIKDLTGRIAVLEQAQATTPAEVPKAAGKAKRSIKKLGRKIIHRKKK